jgi:hypothetical protein
MRGPKSVSAVLIACVCLSQPLSAECVGRLLVHQLDNPDVDVVLRGRVTRIEEVRRDPIVQHVTLLVDRVWKGENRRTFPVYNVPLNWQPATVVRTPDGGVIVGSTSGGGTRPFELDVTYVIVARRLMAGERRELGVGANEERYGTSYCRDGSRTVREAEINHEFEQIGSGRAPQ